MWCACKKPLLLSSSIEQQNISFAKQLNEEFPFADTQTLKSFSNDKQILNYQFAQKLALSELIGTGQPVIRMCAAGRDLHWTLCYQTQQGGSRWWTQYKFRQIDNASKIRIPLKPTPQEQFSDEEKNFTEMDWWNLYLKVLWI